MALPVDLVSVANLQEPVSVRITVMRCIHSLGQGIRRIKDMDGSQHHLLQTLLLRQDTG